MLNLEFEYYLPTKIICKKDAVDDVGKIALGLGKKALLVLGQKSMERLGYMKRVTEALQKEGVEVIHYKGISEEPSSRDLDRAAETARDSRCDFIIALGGGSVIDASKAIAVGATHPGKVVDYLRSKKYGSSITSAALPIIAIPSTAGSGSETTCYSILNNREDIVKDAIVSQHIYPKICIIDPVISTHAPNHVKVSAGLDVLTHAFEAYISKKASLMIQGIAMDSIKTVFEYLPLVVADSTDIEAHTRMAVASAMAGMAIAEAGTVVGHGTAHAWGGATSVTHGEAVAALLPWVVRINKSAAREKLAYVADCIGLSGQHMDADKKISKLENKIRELYQEVGFDIKSLRRHAAAVSEKDVASIAMKQPVIANNPYPVKHSDIESFFKSIAGKD